MTDNFSYGAFGEGGRGEGSGYTGSWGSISGSKSVLNWMRYKDTGNGRWLTRDPIGTLGGFNSYAYVVNRWVNLIDPAGLSPSGPYNCASTEPLAGSMLPADRYYEPEHRYRGISARCMFNNGGDNEWGNIVRSCLVCMYKNGASDTDANDYCYLIAAKRTGAAKGAWGLAVAVFQAVECLKSDTRDWMKL